jgi:hypothetical protein
MNTRGAIAKEPNPFSKTEPNIIHEFLRDWCYGIHPMMYKDSSWLGSIGSNYLTRVGTWSMHLKGSNQISQLWIVENLTNNTMLDY